MLTSVSYLADLVREVTCGGAAVRVESLVPSNRDPHTFALTPADRAKLGKADAVVAIGAGFEPWLAKVRPAPHKGSATASATASATDRWLVVTEGLKLESIQGPEQGPGKGSAPSNLPKESKETKRERGHGPGPGHSHHHGHANEAELDPHIWHSPVLTRQAAGAIADFLVAQRKGNSALVKDIARCRAAFEAKVDETVASLNGRVKDLPPAARAFATNHDAFGYFARAFGFQVVSVVGVSTDASPTPKQLRAAIESVRKKGIKAVFLETGGGKTAVEAVARETGVKLGGALYADGLGEDGSGAETTLGLWRTNMGTIVSALK